MKQFFRVLKPGASIRIVVPDGEFYIPLYNKARAGEKIKFLSQRGKLSVNRIFQEFTHAFIYDEAMMQQAGFVDIKRASFMRGRDPKLAARYRGAGSPIPLHGSVEALGQFAGGDGSTQS
jgi:hypothetical protein